MKFVVVVKHVIAILLFVVFIAVFYFFDPETLAVFPKCPFRMATGYQCVGCGSQRAIHDLLHFDIKAAFLHNPIAIITIPYVVLGIYLEYFGGSNRFPNLQKMLYGKNAAIIAFCVMILFWVGRNLV